LKKKLVLFRKESSIYYSILKAIELKYYNNLSLDLLVIKLLITL